MAKIQAKPFKLALVQLGGLTADKSHNLEVAAKGVREAVEVGKADVVVLPVSRALKSSLIRIIAMDGSS